MTPLDSILALQGGETSAQRRTRQTRRGQEALDALEELEQGLLLGRAPGALRGRLEALQRRSEKTGDTHLDAVLGWAEEMKVGQLYLSHLNNSMDYTTLVDELPSWAAPAHDGLEIEL